MTVIPGSGESEGEICWKIQGVTFTKKGRGQIGPNLRFCPSIWDQREATLGERSYCGHCLDEKTEPPRKKKNWTKGKSAGGRKE